MTRKEFDALPGMEQMTLFLDWCKKTGKEPKKYESLQEFWTTFEKEEVK